MQPLLSIIIVNWNRKDLLSDCIRSVYEETKSVSFEIFIVDNASSDNSAEMVKSEFPGVNLIRNRENVGFAAANNQAIKRAKGKYILLLNSDTVIQNSAIENLVNFMAANPRCGVVGPQLFYPDGRLQYSYDSFISLRKFFYLQTVRSFFSIFPIKVGKRLEKLSSSALIKNDNSKTIEVDSPKGACFMVSRGAIEEVGLLDERFFMYCEEVDWSLRIKRNGWKNYFYPSARVIHHKGASVKKNEREMLKEHWRSDYKFFRKHYGRKGIFLLKSIFLSALTFKIVRELVRVHRKRIFTDEIKNELRDGWSKIWVKY